MTTPVYMSTDIPDRLWDASAREARFVVTNYTRTDEHSVLKVALSFGLATEYLIMSALASLDVALLADHTSTYSKLALSTARAGLGLNIKQLKTVNYGTALKVLLEHRPYVVNKDVDSVMGIRNAAAHMAMGTQQDNSDAMSAFLKVVEGLHRYRPTLVEDDYWGADCLDVVQNLRDEQVNQQKADFDALVLAAKTRKQALDEQVPASEREHVYSGLESRLVEEAQKWPSESRSASEHPCPACGRTGRVGWTRHLWDDFEQVATYDSVTDGSAPAILVTAEREATDFKCLVCGFEIGKSGIHLLPNLGDVWVVEEERHELRDDELSDYYDSLEAYEPDPDIWLGER
ncbi:hypothetical protein [Microbacterium sp. EST19A]|uniref:hypothetical protein n=1 Tax=Microbacterium sp. EST19A TaxID=2862681 RepID=UPI001CBEEC19|nr:hypothetical protein [Microbacterium sp. EST19A]